MTDKPFVARLAEEIAKADAWVGRNGPDDISLTIEEGRAILALVEAATAAAQGHKECGPNSGCTIAALRPALEALSNEP